MNLKLITFVFFLGMSIHFAYYIENRKVGCEWFVESSSGWSR